MADLGAAAVVGRMGSPPQARNRRRRRRCAGRAGVPHLPSERDVGAGARVGARERCGAEVRLGGGCGRGALDVLVLVRPKGNALQPSFAFVRHRPGARDASAPPVEPLPSGRFLARVPKSLHARLTSEAKKEGVSLITLVITLLAGVSSPVSGWWLRLQGSVARPSGGNRAPGGCCGRGSKPLTSSRFSGPFIRVEGA